MFFLPCKDLPVVKCDHPVEIFRMPWLMGDHDDGLTEITVKVPEQFKDLPRCCGIEVGATFNSPPA